jgi:hypothetical protein
MRDFLWEQSVLYQKIPSKSAMTDYFGHEKALRRGLLAAYAAVNELIDVMGSDLTF